MGHSQNTAVAYTEGIRQLFRFYDMDIKDLPQEVTKNRYYTRLCTNKKLVDTFTNISSKKLRNRIAGYITQLQNQKKLTTEQRD